jgi:uncharacterized membrane protein
MILNKLKNSNTLILIGILCLNAYLRLLQITHLFIWIEDYDEGTYSVGARFISHGSLPYRDFTLVHPPFYDLVLASIYKIFGYNFYYGRYFSVLLSLVCIVLVYVIVKKLFNPTAALAASAGFALFPGLTLFWYRAVQEALGVFLVLMAIYFAIDFIAKKEKPKRLFFSGIFLGLALATKYTFLPAVIAVTISIGVLSLEGRWHSLRCAISGLFQQHLWLLISGIFTGFLTVTGYFFVKCPAEFVNQTFLSQFGHHLNMGLDSTTSMLTSFPSGVMHFLNFSAGTQIDTVAAFCFFLSILILVAMLIRRDFSRINRFLLIALFVSLLIGSLIQPIGTMRYVLPAYIFALISMGVFVREFDVKTVSNTLTGRIIRNNIGMVIVVLLLFVFTVGTIGLRFVYNYQGGGKPIYEEQSYKEVISYLEQAGAKKVYSSNPVIPALSTKFSSCLDFDTYGNLFLLKKPAEQIVQEQISDGVDYIILDPFWIMDSATGKDSGRLVREIKNNSVLVKKITLNDIEISTYTYLIYRVNRP